jgi:iron complex transport system permease protein
MLTNAERLRSPAARSGHVVFRNRAIALRLNVRVIGMSGIAALVLCALAAWAMTLGSYPVPLADVIRSALGMGTDEYDFIVRTLRMPRVLAAVGVGAALAVSGIIFQGLVRNPLVSPDIIGIEAGASAAAVFWIVTARDAALVPVAALAGALATAAAIYLLTWKGGISGNRLVLVGIGINTMLGAFTTFLMLRYPIDLVARAQRWTAGSVYASDWADVRLLALTLLILVPVAAGAMWQLRLLQLGDDVARGLGMSVERTRLALIAVGCALAAIAVSVAGPIGFVALIVPHIARALAGTTSASVIVLTAALGAILLLGSDVIAQHVLPVALPVGVVTAAAGAPYFLFLLYRGNVRL